MQQFCIHACRAKLKLAWLCFEMLSMGIDQFRLSSLTLGSIPVINMSLRRPIPESLLWPHRAIKVHHLVLTKGNELVDWAGHFVPSNQL